MKLDLLTNTTVVEDAIRFVGERTKEHENKQDMIGNEQLQQLQTKSFDNQ
jgi:hypothetical protein